MAIQSLWQNSGVEPLTNSRELDDGSTSLRLATGEQFRLQAPPPAITGASIPRNLVAQAAQALNELSMKVHSATSDPSLSEFGQETKIAPVSKLALATVGQLWVALQNFRATVDAREVRLYAIPDPNLNQAGAAIRAWECRQKWDSLSGDEKSALLHKIGSQPDKVFEMISALLTSPYALIDQETQAVSEMWHAARRAQNPTEADAIDADREACHWAAGMLGVVGRMVVQLASTWGKFDVAAQFASLTAKETGYESCGVTEREYLNAKQMASLKAAA